MNAANTIMNETVADVNPTGTKPEAKRLPCVIFDVDGTLLDTAPGVEASVRFAEQELGLAPLPEKDLRKFVGPPPREMYQKLHGLSDEQALAATEKHRQFGREKGLYISEVYPGMVETLDILRAQGVKMGVATLKVQDVAERILAHHGLSHYFGAVVGIDKGENLTKKDTILIALEKMGETPETAVMVGDSVYDLIGAKEAQVRFVGVTYGYGFASAQEITEAGGAAVENAREIAEAVLR